MPTTFLPAVLTVLALLVGAIAGCGSTEPTEATDGEISFLLNGEPWQPTAPPVIARSAYAYEIIADHWIDGRFPLHQGIYFVVPDAEWAGVQRYPLDFGPDGRGGPQRGDFAEMNGDEIVSRYEPLPGGGFEVTRYDEETGQIEGRFEGVYVIDPLDTASDLRRLPDTLRVTEGRFRGVVDDLR